MIEEFREWLRRFLLIPEEWKEIDRRLYRLERIVLRAERDKARVAAARMADGMPSDTEAQG